MRFSLSLSATAAALLIVAAPDIAIGAPIASLSGPDGNWDYARVDPVAGRLYVARSGSVTMFDLDGRTPARSIGRVDHGHAVIPIPGTTSLLVTSGRDDSVRLLDTRDGHELARIPVGGGPDAAVLDPAGSRAYVMDAEAGSVAVIDLAHRAVIATVPLRPGLEYGAIARDGTLFVNNEDADEIETIDLATLKPGAAIALSGCEGPTGLGYDDRTDRLISACANGRAAVIDAGARRVVALLAIGAGPDAVIVDGARRRAYIPCGKSGALYVVSLDGASGPAVTGTIPTGIGARTGALDPRSGMLYLPAGRFGPSPAPDENGAFVPGSFHVLVVRPGKAARR